MHPRFAGGAFLSRPSAPNARPAHRRTVVVMETEKDVVTRRGLRVPAAAFSWTFDRAGGPGGQHRNKTMTRARARVDLTRLAGPAVLLERVLAVLGTSVELAEGASRSQWRNRERLVERLVVLLDDAAAPRVQRRPTRPGRAAVERRLAQKRRDAERKERRRRLGDD